MRKEHPRRALVPIAWVAVFTVLFSGCTAPAGESRPADDFSSIRQEETFSTLPEPVFSGVGESQDWEAFCQQMENEGVSYERLRMLENAGISQETIMQMTSREIQEKWTEIQQETGQDRQLWAQALLRDPEAVKNDAQFAYSDHTGTLRLSLLEECLAKMQNGEEACAAGLLMGETLPMLYEITYAPETGAVLTTYRLEGKEVQSREETIAYIYDAALFYQFANDGALCFSIPKESLVDKTVLEDYLPGSDLAGAEITALQAQERAAEMDRLLSGYTASIREDGQNSRINGYGVVIPQNAQPASDPIWSGKAQTDGAAQILGEPYYRVTVFYEDSSLAQNTYYIAARQENRVFMVSMVAGELIPISCQDAKLVTIPK